MRRFDRVSTISERMLEQLATKEVEAPRRFFFPNWADTEAIHPLCEPSPLRAELHIDPNVIVVLYAGTMGEKQGLETVAETARALTDNHHIQFIFCGDGGARRRLYQKNYASSSRVPLAACLNVVREIFPAQAPAWYTHRTQVCCPTHSSARSGFLGRSARAGRATERRPQRLTFRRLQLPGRKNGPGATASLRDFWWPMPNTSPFRTTALM